MTDKATVTIGAPQAGTVLELCGGEGDVIPVGETLVIFDTSAGGAAPAEEAPQATAQKSEAPSTRESAATAVGDIKEDLPGTNQAPAAAPAPASGDKPLAAPATRKLARELDVDLTQVAGSGSAGRITREDVEKFASSGRSAPGASPATGPAPISHSAPPAAPQDKRIPIRGLRKRIFENMARSKRTAAHFTYVDECDVTSLKDLRSRTKPYAERAGVKLTFLPFIVKAVVASLKKHRQLNSLVDDAALEYVQKGSYDIGIATATEAGLIVPVLRNADRLSIIEIAGELERLAADARIGKSKAEDLGGSSFTITSLGKLGGLFATPVVNYPEVAILGIHEMKRKPVVRGEQIVIGEVMLLSLSFDHRIVDGHVGAAFAQEIVGLLQEPDRLLVEMA
jgi:pyruvate dehydrogenase E2 component (dihydrolipoamide acetyltransferase)